MGAGGEGEGRLEGEGAVGEDGVEEGLVCAVWGGEVRGCGLQLGRWSEEVWAAAGCDVTWGVEPEEDFAGDEPVIACGLGEGRCAVSVVVETAYADFESVGVAVAEER